MEHIHKLEEIGAEFKMKAVILATGKLAKESMIQKRAKRQRILG